MTPDHTRLRQLAEAAQHPHGWFYLDELTARFEADIYPENMTAVNLIAVTAPSTVLALLDEIAALRAGQGTPTGDTR